MLASGPVKGLARDWAYCEAGTDRPDRLGAAGEPLRAGKALALRAESRLFRRTILFLEVLVGWELLVFAEDLDNEDMVGVRVREIRSIDCLIPACIEF